MLSIALLLALVAPPQTAPGAGSTDVQRFLQGVEAYRRGDPATAESLWRALVESDGDALDPAVICYDLGNAAFRLDRPLEAAGWYTAALRLEPRHGDAWANLELARERAGLDPADRGDLVDTLRRLAWALTRGELEWTLIALAGALLAVLGVEAFRGGVALRRSAWVLAVAIALLTGLWAWRAAAREQAPMFVTRTEGAELRSEPRGDSAVVGRAEPAEIVERLDGLPGWERVRATGGQVGWVQADTLLTLPSRGTR
jgi:tetratricopeptide (TPR) repeat protein